MLIESLFTNPIFFCRVIVIITISISLHELGHGIAAISQGDRTPIERGHMTINPIVHMGIHSLFFLCLTGMAWGQMPVSPYRFRHPKWSNIIVSAAGPFTNFILGFVGVVILKLSLANAFFSFISSEFFSYVAYFNFALGFFNLCPIPPLDGFHVASEIFPEIKPWERSQMGLALFMILFISGAGSVFFIVSKHLVAFLVDL